VRDTIRLHCHAPRDIGRGVGKALVRAPNQEPHDLGVLRIASEDGGRVFSLDWAQDQAGGFETVRQHEVNARRAASTTSRRIALAARSLI